MAYWIHYNGGYIAYGEDAIINNNLCKKFNKDEFFKVDHISSFTSLKLINRIYYECFERLGKYGLSKNICAVHFEDPAILNYCGEMNDVFFSELDDRQIADIRLEHIAKLDKGEAEFHRRCTKAAKERDDMILAFELDTEPIEESPVFEVEEISLDNTGDFSFDFEFEDGNDNSSDITFAEPKQKESKPKTNNNLKLF